MMETRNRDLKGEQNRGRYLLRHAAGIYWLMDVEQPGIPYVKPVPMNEMGADIWRLHGQGLTTEEIAGQLSAAYQVPAGQARKDVLTFLEQLKAQGVQI
ncbi:MAG: PqqD family protein [Lachnospiraceae bacterium]|nr:PqqD family protein [Lachnospiraceae bacterium]